MGSRLRQLVNLAHLTKRSEQPASPVLLTRNGPLRAKGISKERKFEFNPKSIHFWALFKV